MHDSSPVESPGHGWHFPLPFHDAKRNQVDTSSFMVKLYTLSPADAENLVATVTVVNEEWLLIMMVKM
jgi:hypothetical protein